MKCVFSSLEDGGHMLECELCTCWSHCSCIGISPSVASSMLSLYLSICVKSSFTLLSSLQSEILKLSNRVDMLESTIDSTLRQELKSIHVSLNDISTKNQYQLSFFCHLSQQLSSITTKLPFQSNCCSSVTINSVY